MKTAQGPFDFPLPDSLAFKLERIMKTLPHDPVYALHRKPVLCKASGFDRSDISWISEESIDRTGDIVLANGMDDSVFTSNPIVTLNHNYELAPVALSAWRKQSNEGGFKGIKAKTIYPSKPGFYPENQSWVPDQIFALVQTGLLAGKSIGFLPLQVREPSYSEIQNQPYLSQVRLIIEKWLLLEYACCAFPAQPRALVQSVGIG